MFLNFHRDVTFYLTRSSCLTTVDLCISSLLRWRNPFTHRLSFIFTSFQPFICLLRWALWHPFFVCLSAGYISVLSFLTSFISFSLFEAFSSVKRVLFCMFPSFPSSFCFTRVYLCFSYLFPRFSLPSPSVSIPSIPRSELQSLTLLRDFDISLSEFSDNPTSFR